MTQKQTLPDLKNLATLLSGQGFHASYKSIEHKIRFEAYKKPNQPVFTLFIYVNYTQTDSEELAGSLYITDRMLCDDFCMQQGCSTENEKGIYCIPEIVRELKIKLITKRGENR